LCLGTCTTPYAVSFDDDSFPVDPDFFASVVRTFDQLPDAAVVGGAIWHPHETEKPRTKAITEVASYVGCGHAIRVEAYRAIRGYLPRPKAYGMEESDVSLQLVAAGWRIYESGDLRIFHDSKLAHHAS